ncbi:unnamed protein product [Tilletia controversa]|nr:hypothetical protein CF336_g6943 [Tilletia laevis]KAE8189103.1 hypothetical protein CF328_g6386 [Tilletia controversa]KAE8239971.1 hypothetical protein A4X03_0g8629 [Tilletia caries]CAD6914523.1 unnamed protein product [Tilletia controversa]CAD7068558.1 unnamed protein product [Tilletia caries]
MSQASSRSRSGPAGRYLLSQAVDTCALEPVHFQPVFKLLPRSMIAEATAQCQQYRKMSKATSSHSPEPLAFAHSVNLSYLPKTIVASLVGVLLLVFAVLNPVNAASWFQSHLATLHMQLSGEQDDEDEDVMEAAAAAAKDENDGMDEEEREIALAAARYQLALESERRLRVFGAVANSSSATAFGGLRIDFGNGSQASPSNNSSVLTLAESNMVRRPPIVLTDVPALPSWRKSKRQQQQQQQQDSFPSSSAPASPQPSSPCAGSDAPVAVAPVELEQQQPQSSRPELASHNSGSSSGSSSSTIPATGTKLDTGAAAPSFQAYEDENDVSPSLSPTTTCALPTSDSASTQADPFQLYGPPLSPSFGALDDAEDFARSALGSAAIAAAASSCSGGEERGLARLVRLEGLVDPDDFDLSVGEKESDWAQRRDTAASPQRPRRRRRQQQHQSFSQVRRFLFRGGANDSSYDDENIDDGETDVEREEEPLYRTRAC